MNVIEVQALSKAYGNDFALKDINLEINKGTIFSLLGPNGAGKTTLVKLILNLLHKDQGSITINGLDASNKLSRVNLAFIPEKFNFFPFYTAKGVLEFFGKMKGVEGAQLEEQVNYALERLHILDLKNKKLSKMSKGQVQRVGLASILIGNNDLIILDEPFSGLDPIGIRDLKEIIAELKAQGKTLFINSHILLEMEQICDEFAIMNKGHIIHKSSVAEITGQGINLEEFFYKMISEGGR